MSYSDTAEVSSGEAPVSAPAERKITLLNRSAVKKYALAVSKAKRAGKFTRVGETFYIGCEAEMDSALRKLANELGGQLPTGELTFTTKTTRTKAVEKLEQLAAIVIHGKVMRHPSIGQTLKD